MLTHEQKIKRVIEQLKRHDPSKSVSLKKKTVSHEVPKPNDKRYSDDFLFVAYWNNRYQTVDHTVTL